ncbi:hypothetical protein [Jiulongibacter sp. NS-SX5]|uniref:hypothetical protein n=1 Tax=Jiulongibacter sp. NS-SX5 TaxID=3463854 RepID=UPI0040587534
MKTQLLTLLIISSALISCKDEGEPQAEISIEDEIAQLPEIEADRIEQHQIKTIKISTQLKDASTETPIQELKLEYTSNGKLASVKRQNEEVISSYDYTGNSVSNLKNGIQTIYQLDNSGLGVSDTKNTQYYYKSGFLVRTVSLADITEYIYNQDGNLTSYGPNASFTYTNLKNTIRQEVFGPMTFHSTFREDFLGRFSTNLLETASFREDGINYSLQFSYTLDNTGRVSQMVITRTSTDGIVDGVITYDLGY